MVPNITLAVEQMSEELLQLPADRKSDVTWLDFNREKDLETRRINLNSNCTLHLDAKEGVPYRGIKLNFIKQKRHKTKLWLPMHEAEPFIQTIDNVMTKITKRGDGKFP